MKKYLIAFAAASLIFAGLVNPAQAHVLQSDGSIGAVLHIDPADDPIVGEPATFFFDIKDKQNKFTAAQCKCTLQIIKEGAVIFTQQLFSSNAGTTDINTPLFTFTFPERAIYTVLLIGEPSSVGAFQSFRLSYDVRADRVSNSPATQNSSGSSHLVLYIILGALFLAAFFTYQKRRYKTSKSPPPDTMAS